MTLAEAAELGRRYWADAAALAARLGAPALPFEPAGPADLATIEAAVARMRLDAEDLRPEQFMVARQDGRIVAFGRIKPYGAGVFELGSVAVLEEARGRGWGERVVRELVRRFPTPEVWITTDLVAWFERLGFRRVPAADAPPAIADKLGRVCGKLRQGVEAMVLHRR